MGKDLFGGATVATVPLYRTVFGGGQFGPLPGKSCSIDAPLLQLLLILRPARDSRAFVVWTAYTTSHTTAQRKPAPPPTDPLQPHVLRPRPRAPVHGHGEHEAQGPERVSREGARCRLARAPLLRLQGRPRRCAGSLGPPDARVRWPEGGDGSVKGPDAPSCLPPAPADATSASSLVCLRDDENNSVGASQ